MFKSIKLRVIKGRKLNPFAVAKVLQEHEDRIKALESEEPSPEPITRDISFTINDGTGPVEGATVTIGSITGTTGSAGGCTLHGVEEGDKIVMVTKEGFTDYSDTITIDAEHTSFTISLTAENTEPGQS